MDRIRSFVALARRRLFLEAWLAATLQAGVCAGAVLVLLVVERRVTGGTGGLGLPSGRDGTGLWLAVVAVLAGLASAYGAWRARRAAPSETSAALELDARLQTDERFTTALEVVGREDAFARAAVADAIECASAPGMPRAVRERFAITPPRRWWWAPALVTVAAVLWVALPQFHVFAPAGAPATAADAMHGRTPEVARLEAVVHAIEQSPELEDALHEELDNARRAIAGDMDARTPDEAARESLRRMAELQERLAQIRGSAESQSAEALRDALAKLELPPESNMVRDLAEALKRGDFAAAKDAVRQLEEAMQRADLTQEQRDALAGALQQTAQQLQQLSKDPQRLADALKQAGIDPAVAQNPAAMQQAVQQSSALNQTQKDALLNMMQSTQSSQERLAQMSQQLNSMATQCENPGAQQGSQGGQGQRGSSAQQAGVDGQRGSQAGASGQSAAQDMSGVLSQAEAEQLMAQAASNAQSQCSGGAEPAQGDSTLRSAQRGASKGGHAGGMGGSEGSPGSGAKGAPPSGEQSFAARQEKQRGVRGEGDIIARQLVEGQSPIGESRVAMQAVADKIAAGVDHGSDEDPVPAHLRAIHQKYFGDMQRKLQERGVRPTAAPAGGAGDTK